jgi:predicted nucleic acid-binding protein
MNIFLDTNIFLRLSDENSNQHELVVKAVAQLLARGEELYFAPQSMIEFWAVATRPIEANGLGLDVESVEKKLEEFSDEYKMLKETPALYGRWLELVKQYAVQGKQVHDTRLVAQMLVHDINTILTINMADFKRFSSITAIHPEQVLKGEA